jgi:hypothetical protein
MTKSLLAVAIERQNWELAALCLLYGMAKAIETLPAETVEALLALLEKEDARVRPE